MLKAQGCTVRSGENTAHYCCWNESRWWCRGGTSCLRSWTAMLLELKSSFTTLRRDQQWQVQRMMLDYCCFHEIPLWLLLEGGSSIAVHGWRWEMLEWLWETLLTVTACWEEAFCCLHWQFSGVLEVTARLRRRPQLLREVVEKMLTSLALECRGSIGVCVCCWWRDLKPVF